MRLLLPYLPSERGTDRAPAQTLVEGVPVHARSFLAGSLFSAVGMAGGGVLTVFTGIVFARWLGPESFGLYSLALAAITVLGGFGTAGMDATVARFAAFYLGTGAKQKIRAVVQYGIWWALVASGVLAILAGLGLPARGTSLSPLGVAAWFVAAAIPVLGLQFVLQQALSGLQFVRTRVFLEKIVQPMLRLALPFALLWICSPLQAALGALSLTALLVSAVAGVVLWRNVRDLPGAKAELSERREWFRYALPFALNALQNFLFGGMGIDVLLLGVLASIKESGIYAAAFRFAPVVLLGRGAMDYTFGPQVGVLYGKSDFKAIASLYKMSSAVSLTWTMPLGVVLAVFGRPLMSGLFGPVYAEGGTALAVLALGLAVDGATGCNTTLLSVMGRPWLVLMNGLISGVVTAVLCFVLIPHNGMVGAAFAVAVGRATANVMTTTQIWHLQTLQPFDGLTAKILAAGVVAAAIGLLGRSQVDAGSLPVVLLAVAAVIGAYVIILRLMRLQWSPL